MTNDVSSDDNTENSSIDFKMDIELRSNSDTNTNSLNVNASNYDLNEDFRLQTDHIKLTNNTNNTNNNQ